MKKIIICLACVLACVMGATGTASNENATDEEILSYARGVIDAGSRTAVPSIDNRTLGIDVYLESYKTLGSIGYAAYVGGGVTDKVCSEYPGRFNRTIVCVLSKDGDRYFGYIVLNRAT